MSTQPLKFLGNHGCFSNQQNSAYFITPENEMVLIDCPPSAYYQFVDKSASQAKKDLEDSQSIYVLITHTHGDHVGGLDMLIHYAYWALKKELYVIAPSEVVGMDLQVLLHIKGCTTEMYNLWVSSNVAKEWFVTSIPTTHVKELEGKCFGYSLIVDGKKCIFTGDTATIEPFLPYLSKGSYLYADTAMIRSGVHLNIQDSLPIYSKLAKDGVKIFLMHTDDENAIQQYIEESVLDDVNIQFALCKVL